MKPRLLKTKPAKTNWLRRAAKDKRATAAVEMALVAPVFMLVVFGIIEIGRAWWAMHTLEYAMESTARHALVNPTISDGDLAAYAQTTWSGMHPNSASLNVTITRTTVSGVSMINVAGAYTFSSVVPLPGGWDSVPLQSDARLVVPAS